MKRTLAALSTLAFVPAAVLVSASPAHAAPAKVTVTIKAEGVDLSGQVKSTKRKCKADRTVVVFRQRGARGGGDDERFASDTTGLQNGRWTWSTGNTGTEGRFYAKVGKKPGCRRDFSKTIRATRDD